MPKVNALVDDQALHLMEHRRVGGVTIAAIDPARGDNAHRLSPVPTCCQHGADLHRAGVGAQHHLAALGGSVGQIESVVHRPRRMALGHIERGEIVPVVLDLRPGRHGKAHVGKNLGQLVHHLRHRMHRSAHGIGRGQGQVDRLGGQAGIQRGGFKRGFCRRQRLGHPLAQGVDFWPRGLALLWRQSAQRFQQRRDRALLAEKFDPEGLHRIQRVCACDARQRVLTDCLIIHRVHPSP